MSRCLTPFKTVVHFCCVCFTQFKKCIKGTSPLKVSKFSSTVKVDGLYPNWKFSPRLASPFQVSPLPPLSEPLPRDSSSSPPAGSGPLSGTRGGWHIGLGHVCTQPRTTLRGWGLAFSAEGGTRHFRKLRMHLLNWA